MSKKPNFGTILSPFRTNLSHQRLDIGPSYHPIQFKEKLENQRLEIAKKTPNFRPDFGLFELNLGSKIVFRGCNLYCMLKIVNSHHCMQLQQKRMIQTQ